MEATRPTTVLATRAIDLGTWNLRIMYETGKTAQVPAKMRNHKLSLLGIRETRWTQAGQKGLNSGQMLLYSGHEKEDGPRTQGVALMLSKTAQRAFIGWEAHGPRIITASFQTKKRRINMNVIQCYAPTNDSKDEDKDQFYNRLQSVIDTSPEGDVTVLMGDLNAKIGSDDNGYEEVLGQYGLGEMNDNGERLADVCSQQGGRTWLSVSPPRDSQGEMDIARPIDRESDRSHLY